MNSQQWQSVDHVQKDANLQNTLAIGMSSVPVAFEIARQIKATFPRFQTAFIDKRNKIGRIVYKF